MPLDDRQLRNRQAALEEAIGRELADMPPATPARVIKLVAKVTFPTSAAHVFACKTQKITIATQEKENAAVTLTDDSDIYYAVNIGSRLPTINSYWVAWPVQGLWVFGQNA